MRRQKKPVPPIVRIVLTQATRSWGKGEFGKAAYEAQIRRLEREELEPKGLTLLVRKLSGGGMRFIIKEESSGEIDDLIDVEEFSALESKTGYQSAVVDDEEAKTEWMGFLGQSESTSP